MPLLVAVVLALLLAAPAGAATVSARVAPDDRSPSETLTLRVGPAAGERNDLTLSWTASEFVVRDATAPLTAEHGCVQAAPDEVRCAVPPPRPPFLQRYFTASLEGGDKDDRLALGAATALRADVSLNGGEGDDTIAGGGVPAALYGSEGADTILGGPAAEGVSGGRGSDVLRGGEGNDTLIGDDYTLAPARPADDVIDGGPGVDTVNYQEQDGLVDVDLADDRPDGALGESDTLSGIENATGGGGVNVLRGDEGPNVLTDNSGTGFGRDRLEGRGGDDVLDGGWEDAIVIGGDGDDRLVAPAAPFSGFPLVYDCGPGADVIASESLGVLRPFTPDCERAEVGRAFVVELASARVSPGRLRFGLVPLRASRGRLTVRDARGRVLGARDLAVRGRGYRTVAVPLRRVAARGALRVAYRLPGRAGGEYGFRVPRP